MDNYRYSSHIFLIFISTITLCYCQIAPYITEPKLTSVIPINSTALTLTWQFADLSVDRSDLIQISIIFYEYYYSYNKTYPSIDYTFTSTNKTITNLTKNFELVNAYYYVCFSSNSSITNVTQYLFVTNCILTRTCLRSNAACPPPSNVLISSANIQSNSFLISFLWPNDLPYTPISFTTQLINTNQTGTALNLIQNTTYTNRSYQFTGLQSRMTYTINTSFTYTILNSMTKTNTTILTVTTSCSLKLVYTGDFLVSFFSFSVILFTIFFYK
ncbi:unnamed protein product [Adineta steineri]|uniref:Fibronectin type-III domain-containing protein n=1 Tax=Adineta steineri TaxID=433720 RepID=A0A814R7T5_9BILA|nr:unnamed protein product [Adineta steineri]CAF1130227.1 unnamed protein product [Adineta steineri]CAF3935994.1 unnamed protein product [Adineta steineri]